MAAVASAWSQERRRRNPPPSPWNVPSIKDEEAAAAAAVPAPADVEAETETEHLVAATPPATVTPTTSADPRGEHVFTWVAAHGGAGATSLARASGQGEDLTKRWPDVGSGWPSQVAVVCRYNAAGLAAAAALVREVASGAVGEVAVVALVVVADAPSRRTKELRRRLYELSSTVPGVVQVPWIDAWREDPYTPHPAATKAAAAVAALTLRNTTKETP